MTCCSVGAQDHSSGKERDAESGNDYMFARYYNSATGRFLSPDWSAKGDDPVPYADLHDPQSLNLYSYVRNHPLNMADPDGHCCDWLKQQAQQSQQWIADHPRTVEGVKAVATGVATVVTVAAVVTAAPVTGGGSVVAAVAMMGAAGGAAATAVYTAGAVSVRQRQPLKLVRGCRPCQTLPR